MSKEQETKGKGEKKTFTKESPKCKKCGFYLQNGSCWHCKYNK